MLQIWELRGNVPQSPERTNNPYLFHSRASLTNPPNRSHASAEVLAPLHAQAGMQVRLSPGLMLCYCWQLHSLTSDVPSQEGLDWLSLGRCCLTLPAVCRPAQLFCPGSHVGRGITCHQPSAPLPLKSLLPSLPPHSQPRQEPKPRRSPHVGSMGWEPQVGLVWATSACRYTLSGPWQFLTPTWLLFLLASSCYHATSILVPEQVVHLTY